MKCLLCELENDKDNLIKHYINFRKVDPQNYFFKYLFFTDNETLCRECCRCNEFITTKEHQRRHNFLEHYSDGKNYPLKKNLLRSKIFET